MENNSTSDTVAVNRWLLNNGLITSTHQNTLYTYGYLAHDAVEAVDMQIDLNTRNIQYVLYVGDKFLKTLNEYNKLQQSRSLWSLWRRRRIIKKYGCLDLQAIIAKHVQCAFGKEWAAVVTDVKSMSEYTEAIQSPGRPENTSSDLR